MICFLALNECCCEFYIKHSRRGNCPFCTVFARRNNSPAEYRVNNTAARMDNVYVIAKPAMRYPSERFPSLVPTVNPTKRTTDYTNIMPATELVAAEDEPQYVNISTLDAYV